MTAKPLVSVILPVKNCGEYLPEAVDSVLGQTFRDLEIILVDDHSTDGSVQALGRDDARLKIFSNPGEGLVDALNAAAAISSGELLARMDGDDVSEPSRIARQVELMDGDKDIGVSGCLVEVVADAGVGEGYRAYESWINSLVSREDIEREIFVESPLPHPTTMIRRGVFRRLGGYRDMGWPEDYDLWLRAYEAGVGMAKVPEVLLKWRDWPKRVSKTCARYSRESFMSARAHFLKRTKLKNRAAVIWGAGKTGGLLCKRLRDEGAEVAGFIDINPRKIGKMKSGAPVIGPEAAGSVDELILVAVASRGARDAIRAFLNSKGKREGESYLCAV